MESKRREKSEENGKIDKETMKGKKKCVVAQSAYNYCAMSHMGQIHKHFSFVG